MYQTQVALPEQAIAHLFFHCCFLDEIATETETASIADKLVATGLHTELNLKTEVQKYKDYQPFIANEKAYIDYLASLINRTNSLALYSYCIELCFSDLQFNKQEEGLLDLIADALGIEESEKQIAKKLVYQRKVVETKKLF